MPEIRENLTASDYHRVCMDTSKIDPSKVIVAGEWYVCPHCGRKLVLEHGVTVTCGHCNLVVTRHGDNLECVLNT